MSAFPHLPDHFLHWAQQREQQIVDGRWLPTVTASSFLPRRVYGDYLHWLLAEAETQTPAHRHRVAPSIGTALEEELRRGQVIRHVGRLQNCRSVGNAVQVNYRPCGEAGNTELAVGAVARW